MPTKEVSIGALIDRLAGQTGAPSSFVQRIRALFSDKSIPLEGDSTAYLTALEQAFGREQSIRHTAAQARDNLERLQKQLQHFNEVCRKQLSRMESVRSSFGRLPGGPLPETLELKEVQVVEVRKPSSLEVRRDKSILVPGPKDLQ